jgi:uncharacterized protein with PQ loop repeat
MSNIFFPVGGLVLINILGFNLFYSYYSNINKQNNELTINNIFIFIVFFFNSINWMMYGLFKNNLWIFLAGICMPIGSILCIMLLYNTLTNIKKRILEIIFFLAYLYILVYIIIINFAPLDTNIKNLIINYSLLFNIFYFITPLLSFITIIKNKNTKTLYLPFTMINITASTLWLVYGIILNNYFLISIYALGIMTSIIEINLLIYYNFCIPKYTLENYEIIVII